MIPVSDLRTKSRVPYMTWVVLVLIVLPYLATFISDSWIGIALDLGVVPNTLGDPSRAHTLVAHLFVHISFLHVLPNAFFFRVFADDIEDVYGPFGLLFVFIGGGALGAVLQAISTPGSIVPIIGASGGISAVLGAYFRRFPTERVVAMLFIFVELPAWVFVILFLGVQALLAFTSSTGGVEIAVVAHLTGLVFGLVFASAIPAAEAKRAASGSQAKENELANRWLGSASERRGHPPSEGDEEH